MAKSTQQNVTLEVAPWANNAHKNALEKRAMMARKKAIEKKENKEALCKIIFFIVLIVAFAWANH